MGSKRVKRVCMYCGEWKWADEMDYVIINKPDLNIYNAAYFSDYQTEHGFQLEMEYNRKRSFCSPCLLAYKLEGN